MAKIISLLNRKHEGRKVSPGARDVLMPYEAGWLSRKLEGDPSPTSRARSPEPSTASALTHLNAKQSSCGMPTHTAASLTGQAPELSVYRVASFRAGERDSSHAPLTCGQLIGGDVLGVAEGGEG